MTSTAQGYWTLVFYTLLGLMPRGLGRVVMTSQGPVSGLVVTGADVEMFRGLPYAKVVRFSPPEALHPRSRVRPATAFSPACPQTLASETNRGMQHLQAASASLRAQSEDCLTLNIYAPLQASTKSRHPVMVFVDGEGFQWGGGHLYDGTMLASRGRIVVVTVNYRLGVLGKLH
ncbi:liver carboxylesterase-like [Macrosteles quadrilineatus]|uniref:liver carboxylesterase-like n=1 Tax=Macrosteles quadrilineatus TaxID=74068 RepID=UPI0023E1267D|nr:liver carboxylesterase-like [Macrosteles quadrilineatus]